MKKEEPTTKKTEAKEAGATITVKYEDIQKKRKRRVAIYVTVAVFVLVVLVSLIFILTKVRVPRFMLDDVSLDPISRSKVLVSVFNQEVKPNN